MLGMQLCASSVVAAHGGAMLLFRLVAADPNHQPPCILQDPGACEGGAICIISAVACQGGAPVAEGAAQVMASLSAQYSSIGCLGGGSGLKFKPRRKQLRKRILYLQKTLCDKISHSNDQDACLIYLLPKLQLLEKQLSKRASWRHHVLSYDQAIEPFSIADVFAFGCIHRQVI